MRIHTKTSLFLIIPALLLSACGSRHRDQRGLTRDETLLRVSATGRSENKPDEARFSVGVSTIAGSSELATRLNNEKMAKVVGGIEALGVKGDDIKTQNLTVSRIDYGRNRGQFEANNTVSIRVRKIDSASAALAAATKAGANVLSGPDLVISDPEKAKLSAYAAAFKAAKARADTYAEAAGMTVSRTLVINDGGAQQPGQPFPMMEQAMDASSVVPSAVSAPPIRAGLTIDEVSVQVDFALEPK